MSKPINYKVAKKNLIPDHEEVRLMELLNRDKAHMSHHAIQNMRAGMSRSFTAITDAIGTTTTVEYPFSNSGFTTKSILNEQDGIKVVTEMVSIMRDSLDELEALALRYADDLDLGKVSEYDRYLAEQE